MAADKCLHLRGTTLAIVEIIGLDSGPITPRQPKRAAQVFGAGCRTGHFEPTFINLMGLVRIDKDIAVTVLWSYSFDPHLLMPAVLPTDEIRLDRKNKVLMDTAIFPPDSL